MGQETAWIDIPVSKKYSISLQLLGSRMILVSPHGVPRPEDLIVQERIRKDYLKENGLWDRGVIELHDLKDWGKINRNCRRHLLEFFERESRQEYFRGFIAFNFDFTVFDVFNIFIFRKMSRISLRIVTSFSDAEKAAFNMLEKEGFLSISKENMVSTREYFHKEENFSEGFTLLNQMILYSEIHGELKKQSVKVRFEILRSMLYNASLPQNTHYEILVWNRDSTLQMKTLRYFLTEQFKSNKEYNCSLLCIVCKSSWVEKVFRTSEKLFPIPVFISDNLKDALRQISKRRRDLPQLNQGVFLQEKYDAKSIITQEHFNQYVSELEKYIEKVDSVNGSELEKLESSLAYDHPMQKAMGGIKNMKLKIDREKRELIKEKNSILFQRNRADIRLLINEIQNQNQSEKLPQKVQTSLLNSFYLSHCAMFEVTGEGNEQLMRCISDIHQSDRRTLVGHLLPSPLARFVMNKEFSSFSPSELSSLTHSDEQLIPYIKSFIQTRKFQYIFFMKSCHSNSIYLYLEIPNDEDYPFPLKDVYDAVFEVYSSIHKKTENIRWSSSLALSEFDDDKDFLIEVLRGFFERSPGHIETIEKAIENNDDQLLKAESHKLKGAAANLFAENLRISAFNLEESALKKNRSSYFLLVKKLKSSLLELKKDVNLQLQLQI